MDSNLGRIFQMLAYPVALQHPVKNSMHNKISKIKKYKIITT